MKKLDEDQIRHGEQRLAELAKALEVNKSAAIRILLNIQKIKKFYTWVNAQTFLNMKINQMEE